MHFVVLSYVDITSERSANTFQNMAKTSAKKILGVIPARYGSSRFPGKPLADIHGKPMIWWVYKQAEKSKLLTDIVIATEDDRIAEACKTLGLACIMTSKSHPTGTDRVAEVAKKIPADLYINVQGDEPLIDPRVIDLAVKPMIDDPSIRVLNLMSEIVHMHELVSSTVPNVVTNHAGEAIFYSRLPIPYPKNAGVRYMKQVCVYGFKPEALLAFSSLPTGAIEQYEEIELLRFIENRIPIRMIEVVSDNIAVDTPSDLKLVREIMATKLGMKKAKAAKR